MARLSNKAARMWKEPGRLSSSAPSGAPRKGTHIWPRKDQDRPARHHYSLCIVLAALLFSTGGAAIKFCALDAWQISCWRSGIAALFLAFCWPTARRHLGWRTLLVGVAYASTLTLFVLGNKYTTAANTVFGQATAPLYLLGLAPLLLKERPRGRDLPFMLIMAVGLACLFWNQQDPTRTAPAPMFGNLCAAGSGFSWAVTLLGLRWLEGKNSGSSTPGAGLNAVLAGNLLACLMALPMALSAQNTTGTWHDWLTVAYLGIVQIGVAYIFLTLGFRRVPALEASLLLFIEPTLNPVWAWLWHGEHPGLLALAGGAGILIASGVRTGLESSVVGTGRGSPASHRSPDQ